jgi:hypothetical protein
MLRRKVIASYFIGCRYKSNAPAMESDAVFVRARVCEQSKRHLANAHHLAQQPSGPGTMPLLFPILDESSSFLMGACMLGSAYIREQSRWLATTTSSTCGRICLPPRRRSSAAQKSSRNRSRCMSGARQRTSCVMKRCVKWLTASDYTCQKLAQHPFASARMVNEASAVQYTRGGKQTLWNILSLSCMQIIICSYHFSRNSTKHIIARDTQLQLPMRSGERQKLHHGLLVLSRYVQCNSFPRRKYVHFTWPCMNPSDKVCMRLAGVCTWSDAAQNDSHKHFPQVRREVVSSTPSCEPGRQRYFFLVKLCLICVRASLANSRSLGYFCRDRRNKAAAIQTRSSTLSLSLSLCVCVCVSRFAMRHP